jgi:ribosomal protein S18 acetylase RimI-like enzyme
MITLKPASDESDFRTVYALESAITKSSALATYPLHQGCLVFDRFMFGNGAADFFAYENLLLDGGEPVGYVLAYLDEGLFAIRLLPSHLGCVADAIGSATGLFEGHARCSAVVNSEDAATCAALAQQGYVQQGEERWQAGLELSSLTPSEMTWSHEEIRLLTSTDIPERVKYADIATGETITEQMYRSYVESVYYRSAPDYVVRGGETGSFIGFATWWTDEDSQTATLEPVACLPEYRRQGIIKNALLHGLAELKSRGIKFAYVSTGTANEASQALYRAVGFRQIGVAHRWTKALQ